VRPLPGQDRWCFCNCASTQVAQNHLLRDFRTGDVHGIDTAPLCCTSSRSSTDTTRPFQVISGYRSPATNEMLRHHSEGVAAGSLHLKGQAIDIRRADVPLGKLRRAALEARPGGAAYYPASDFVHIDTGRVRAGSRPRAPLSICRARSNRQDLVEPTVVAVNVLRKSDRPVLGHDRGGRVEEDHLNRPRQADVNRL
jgi:Bacterial protein of unknown function (DUF882)